MKNPKIYYGEKISKHINKLFIFVFLIIPSILFFIDNKSLSNINISSLGELFGLLSFSLFSATFILAVRHKQIEKFFGSLSQQYKMHIVYAKLAVLAALLHVLLLLPKYADNTKDALDFLWFPTNMKGILLGYLSLLIFIIIIITSLYKRLPYHIWKLLHKITGFAFILAYLHIINIQADKYLNPDYLLTWFVHFSAIFAIWAYFYQAIAKPLALKYKYKIISTKQLNADVLEIELEKKDLYYKAGQYAFISFNAKGLKEMHPFSFASSPKENTLKFAIKKLGDYTSRLPKIINNATHAKLEGPYGDFVLDKAKKANQIWLAGGIGITPFISFVSDIDKNLLKNKKIHLVYCVNNEKEAVYLDILQQKKEELDNFDFSLYESDRNGLINANKIMKITRSSAKDIQNSEIFICAPPVMIKSLKKQFKKLGFNNEQFISEEFDF